MKSESFHTLDKVTSSSLLNETFQLARKELPIPRILEDVCVIIKFFYLTEWGVPLEKNPPCSSPRAFKKNC